MTLNPQFSPLFVLNEKSPISFAGQLAHTNDNGRYNPFYNSLVRHIAEVCTHLVECVTMKYFSSGIMKAERP